MVWKKVYDEPCYFNWAVRAHSSAGDDLPIAQAPDEILIADVRLKKSQIPGTVVVILPYNRTIYECEVDIPYENTRMQSRRAGVIQGLGASILNRTRVLNLSMRVKFPGLAENTREIRCLTGGFHYELGNPGNPAMSDLLFQDTRILKGTLEGAIPVAVQEEFGKLGDICLTARGDIEECLRMLAH